MRRRGTSNQGFRPVSAPSSALRPPRVRAAALVLGCGAALVCSRTSELNAQTVHFRHQASLSLPTRISLQNQVLHVSQKVGVTFGASMTVTFNPRFDVVTGVSYVPGYVMLNGAGRQIEVSTGSHLLSGSARTRYWLLPRSQRLSWEVHTGFGVVFGGRPAYEDLFQSSTVTGILGSTVAYKVGNIARIHLRIQDRLYRVRFGGVDEGSSRSPLQIAVGVNLLFLESLSPLRSFR
jgi:hypothetical protein